MKSVRKYILYGCILTASVGLASCDKHLDNENKAVLTDATQWASEGNADIFFNDVYDQLPQMYNDPENLDNFTDDNDAGFYYNSWKYKDGILDAASSNYGLWNGAGVGIGTINRHNWPALYTAIRKVNTFMKQITTNKANYSEAWYNKRMDEARFLRAFHYSLLFQYWGGVPLIFEPQTRSDSAALFTSRSTYAETLDFLTKTLDTVVNNKYLAVKYNKGQADAGRATLGAAQMLKAHVQLVAASPSFNAATPPGGPDAAKVAGFGNFDNNRWAAAAASFKKFMDEWGGAGKQYNLFPEDSTLWFEDNEYNSEVIFDRQQVANIRGSNYEQYGGPVYILNTYYTWGNYNPTQELVDQFFMANGKPITDPTSGYDPQKPYVGRERRFYKWIVYDGAPYKMDWMPTTDTIYTRIDKVRPSLNQIDFASTDVTNTGYYFKKKLNPRNRPASGLSGANYIYFRYVEVLLGYAEAQNEAVGPDQSVYDAMNAVRARVNLPALPAGLSQTQMRDAIRQERRVELCFENKRFMDILRWRIAHEVLTKDLTGMKIENSVPSNNSGVWVYTPVKLNHPHKFVMKQYMHPIPQQAIAQNPKLVQNPGY
ncbi:RagB/SusD family nutrient uptake outer membrane protein [Paracnuella aquatica]|uniref:RagB/SusD family nutrient uptake outer membrane protein n=1 Tax=Paracnuella aquatica TaxID=2268757 RepID=UPI000DEFDF63|nr:RagB/SusD family nutrient uptake outer membrane protein [Paracnuella aquatica]RPD49043.1 RagB/SusD family nutrient uptake outer membrane protein [Paracnuella aquatica]